MQIHWWHCQWQLLKIWIKSFTERFVAYIYHTARSDTHTHTQTYRHTDSHSLQWHTYVYTSTGFSNIFKIGFGRSKHSYCIDLIFYSFSSWLHGMNIDDTQYSLMLFIITYCFHVQFGFDWYSSFFSQEFYELMQTIEMWQFQ